MNPAPVPASRFSSADFVSAVEPEDLVYFLLNVGDGDTQLILLPESRGVRRPRRGRRNDWKFRA